MSTVTQPLEIVHADLAFYHQSYDGKRYMLVLVDHYSRFLWTFALTEKGQTAATILEWLPYAERSLDSSLKVFRSDRGGEFTAGELQQQFKRLGIQFETSVPGNPQQNGIPERMNRTVKEMLTAVLQHMDLQPKWWTLALPWVTWVRNILPTRALLDIETPFTKATGKKPNLELLKVFGCMCQYLVPLQKQEKLEPKARWGVHAGFAEGMKGWQVLDVETETLQTTRDCYFYEHLSFKTWQQQQQQDQSATPIATHSVWPVMEEEEDSNTDKPVTLTMHGLLPVSVPDEHQTATPTEMQEEDSTGLAQETVARDSQEQVSSGDTTTPDTEGHRADQPPVGQPLIAQPVHSRVTRRRPRHRRVVECYSASLEPVPPAGWSSAMAEDATNWRAAADAEIQMLEQLGTWEKTDLPPGQQTIGTKWVFKRKWDGAGYGIYKARLVAKGFVQQPDRDYGETYAPVSSIVTVRCLLAVAAARDYDIWQADVKNAFLHGDIDRELYIQQPEGYRDGTNRVLKLKKALYGLKQSPLCWFTALQQALMAMQFRRCPAEPALFFKDDSHTAARVWVVVYVDDLLLISAVTSLIRTVFSTLSNSFLLKRIDPVETYLGIELVRNREARRLFIHQQRYLQGATAELSPGSTRTPLTPQLRLDTDTTPAMGETEYLSVVGKVSYAAVSTRPDLSWAHSWLSSGVRKRSLQYVQEAGKTLHYMRATASQGLLYSGGEDNLHLVMYVDASYKRGEHCHTGWVAVLGGAAVSWRCHRQTIRSDSSCTAEFRAAKEATKEVIWLRYLLEFLLCPQSAVPLGCDNRSAVHLMRGMAVRSNSRDLCRDLPLVRDWVAAGEIRPVFVAGENQPADFLTKQLAGPAFNRCKVAVGMDSVTTIFGVTVNAVNSDSSTRRGECCAQDFRVDEYPCLVQLFSQSERENELSIESVQVCESFDGKRQLQQWRRGAGEFGAVTS